MGDDRPGQRREDPNGLIVRRGALSVEAHGRTVVILLCTILVIAALVYEAREVQRVLTDHEKSYVAAVEAARGRIEQVDHERRVEHQALNRRLDILSCAALLTNAERKWVQGQRNITWGDRCPWITPEAK